MFDTKVIISAGIGALIAMVIYDMFVKKAVNKLESAEELDE